MLSKSALFALLTASLALFSQVKAEKSDVIELTADTFDGTIKEHPLILAEFFAPWVFPSRVFWLSVVWTLQSSCAGIRGGRY